MLFSSILFLLYFLPATLAIYYLVPRKNIEARNLVLLAASLLFYSWGEPVYIVLMIYSAFLNYYSALQIGRAQEKGRSGKGSMLFALFMNLLVLGFFKYFGFLMDTFNSLTGLHIHYTALSLPIGISFYTFQALSYIFDVYRKNVGPQKSFLRFTLYLSLFPQLIAGPIVKYRDVEEQLSVRSTDWIDFGEGTKRFVFGLGKKVLLANNFGALYAAIGALPDSDVSVVTYWIGIGAYTLQIYFDFSGYSDMAIGLGKMFGFHFDENFNYPYVSRSITEFWRRWHISLSSWFRDYVYIPLGGNRVKTEARHIFNLFVVWLLTGIWHGANWTFILWGLTYFVLLVTEKKLGLHKEAKYRWMNPLKYIATMFFVIMEWVLFRADSLGDAVHYMSCMFGADGWGLSAPGIFYLTQYRYFWLAAIVGSLPLVPWIGKRLKQEDVSAKRKWAADVISGVFIVGILFVSVSYIVIGSYNPFIYFNF